MNYLQNFDELLVTYKGEALYKIKRFVGKLLAIRQNFLPSNFCAIAS